MIRAPVRVMGILNVTPDSFSDGGRFIKPKVALDHAMRMVGEGADIIDVGGQSTRPGSNAISLEEELDRVLPVIELICARSDIVVSIDTSKPEVMREAVSAGAGFINDVRALREGEALRTAATLGVAVCLMHMQGEPRDMQKAPFYVDVVSEVSEFLNTRAELCEASGLAREKIYVDPGFGFGKTLEHNIKLLQGLDKLVETKRPVLVGMSRKRMIGSLLGNESKDRTQGSVMLAVLAALKGVAILRVHDVAETVDSLTVLSALGRYNIKLADRS